MRILDLLQFPNSTNTCDCKRCAELREVYNKKIHLVNCKKDFTCRLTVSYAPCHKRRPGTRPTANWITVGYPPPLISGPSSRRPTGSKSRNRNELFEGKMVKILNFYLLLVLEAFPRSRLHPTFLHDDEPLPLYAESAPVSRCQRSLARISGPADRNRNATDWITVRCKA